MDESSRIEREGGPCLAKERQRSTGSVSSNRNWPNMLSSKRSQKGFFQSFVLSSVFFNSGSRRMLPEKTTRINLIKLLCGQRSRFRCENQPEILQSKRLSKVWQGNAN